MPHHCNSGARIGGAGFSLPTPACGRMPGSLNVQNIVIVGTGLIGSSFGLALRQAGFTGAITGVSSPPAIAGALAVGAIDRGASRSEERRVGEEGRSRGS